MSSVSNALTQMQNATAWNEAKDAAVNGANKELNQDMFLKLMMEQLKYQDPMNPMSNQDFLAQQATFTQLSELQKLNESITSNNTVTQAVSLIGKEVTLIDPNDSKKTIVGIVEEATFDANGSSIKVGGKSYPLGLVTSIREPGASAETPTTGDETADNTESETTTDSMSRLMGALDGITGGLSKTVDTVEYLASLIAKYLK